jgi:hypothetical protein
MRRPELKDFIENTGPKAPYSSTADAICREWKTAVNALDVAKKEKEVSDTKNNPAYTNT